MQAPLDIPRYTLGEEIANSIIHGIGVVLAIGGLAVLAVFASLRGSAWHIVGCCVFGATLILVYATSTLYHGIQHPLAKAVLRVLDHSAIYLLIAGTYTPFTLVPLRGVWGWSLFGVIWALAITGILLRMTVLGRRPFVSLALYLAMGWIVIVACKPMIDAVAPGGLALLLGGGLAYTSGVGFYAWRKLRYHHAVWHGFVLLGSILHFLAVFFYVVPAAA